MQILACEPGYACDPWNEIIPGPPPGPTASELLADYWDRVGGQGVSVGSASRLPVGVAATSALALPGQASPPPLLLPQQASGLSLTTALLIIGAFVLLGAIGK